MDGMKLMIETQYKQNTIHVLGSWQQVTKAHMQCQTLTLDGVEIEFGTELVCLGAVFNPEFTFAVHIRRLTGKCFYHLQQMRTARRTLTTDAANTLIHAFITSQVNYCNCVFGKASAFHLYPLQSVLHAALCVITQKKKYDHISAAIRDQLHWLPVKQRIDHKLCTLIYNCLHNVAQVYLHDMCSPCHWYRVAPASDQLLTATYGISAQEQKRLALVLLQCLHHPYGTVRDPLLHTDNFAVNWKVLCLIQCIWLEQLRLRDNNLL